VASNVIDHLQWNNTSDSVLCAQLGKGVLQVYGIHAENWTHTLTCGYFKFKAAEWIGSRKILVTLEFHMALAVYDLLQNSIVYIEIPNPIWPCIVFDNDGTHMFIVSKINGYEKLFMMHSQNLDRVIYIQDILGPCEGLKKSPDDRFLCVFNKRKIVILNFLSGNIIGSVDCMLLNAVSWSPNSEYLALGCSLGNVIVLASFNEFNTEFKMCYHLVNTSYDFFMQSNSVLTKTIPSTNCINYVPSKIASIAWSFDCSYLSTFEVDSTFLCIWEKYKLVCVIEFSTKIKKMKWCPSENKLSVVCGTDLMFFWTEEQIPKFQTSPRCIDGTCLLVSKIFWSLNNKDMILSDGKKCLLITT